MELVGGGGGAVLDRVVGKDVAGEGHLNRDESHIGLPQWPNGKESACNAGAAGSIPGSGRSLGGEHGDPLKYSCLQNPMNWRLQSMQCQRFQHDRDDLAPTRESHRGWSPAELWGPFHAEGEAGAGVLTRESPRSIQKAADAQRGRGTLAGAEGAGGEVSKGGRGCSEPGWLGELEFSFTCDGRSQDSCEQETGPL